MQNATPLLAYKIIRELPHDTAHFTQGLEISGDHLIESVGHYGHSALMFEDPASGRVLRSRELPPSEFGEGVTFFRGRLFWLTWREQVAHVLDAQLREVGTHTYEGEGWGITHDDHALIVSDGSAHLQWRDPATFAITGGIDVRLDGRPLTQLNELEYARGRIYANVWLTDRIAVIDPKSGIVEAWIDLAALRDRFAKPPGWNAADDVLNGIAFDPRSGHFFVTGKDWPLLFEIALSPAR